MKRSFLFLLTFLIVMSSLSAQEMDFYAQIPEAPEQYSSGAILGRMVDALGFRYYWATKGLTEKELAYEPGNDGRTIGQTLAHIYDLTYTIATTAAKEPIVYPKKPIPESFEELRKGTLEHIRRAGELFKGSSKIDDHKLQFKRGERLREFPIWNLINGQLVDAIYHVGQIVSQRRTAGNPMDPGVNVFMGTHRSK